MRHSLARKHPVVILLGLLLAVPIGCGGPEQGPSGPEATQQAATPAAPAKLTGPALTVHTFLAAAQRGDDQGFNAMLTSLARTKMAEYNLSPAPAASDKARFEVGEVQAPNDQLARVACRWIETDPETNQSTARDATYVLRNEPEGWRIAGVTRTVFPNEPPMLLNYEDPEDMIRQAKLLEAEIRRRAEAAQSSATTARSPNADAAPHR
ncbi:MAG: hypothetical protein JW888_01095 [Pirellulales bacterium]|nr:hypothetical protein [Pirellulales bacterium]